MMTRRNINTWPVLAVPILLLAICAAGEDSPKPFIEPVKSAGDPVKTPVQKINEDDLQRVVVAPTREFPWVGKPNTTATKQKVVDPNASTGSTPPPSEGSMDLSGDMIAKFFGPFKREPVKSNPALETPDKEVMKMTQNVEIEMVESKSVLRGEYIEIKRDLKSNDTELIFATGNVQLWSPERTAKGEMLKVEMLKGPNGEVIKNQFTLVGDTISKKKATLWLRKDPADPSKVDIIEATRFERDERQDTFKATGQPNAIITMSDESEAPPDPKGAPAEKGKERPAITMGTPSTDKAQMGKASKAAPPKPAAPSGGGAGGGMASMNLSGGGKVNMRADAELFFNGATGILKLGPNAVFIKEGAKPGEGVKLCSDSAIVTLDVPPPGQPASPGAAFGGDMKSLEMIGHVEIKTGTSTILCDKFKFDAELKVAFMEMNDKPEPSTKGFTDAASYLGYVLVYNGNDPAVNPLPGGSLIIAPRTLKMNMDTQEMEAGGPMKTKSYSGPPGSNRGNGPKPEDVKPPIEVKTKSGPFGGAGKPDPKKPAK